MASDENSQSYSLEKRGSRDGMSGSKECPQCYRGRVAPKRMEIRNIQTTRLRNSAASGPAIRSSQSTHADAFTRGSREIAGGGSELGPGRGELFEGTQ